MPFTGFDAEEKDLAQVTPLSAKEAQELRDRNPSVTPWQVVGWQCGMGSGAVLLTWLLSDSESAVWSVAYGVLVVVVPSLFFARGLARQFLSRNLLTAGLGFFLWEIVKISLSIGLLFAAPKLVDQLDWLFLLLGLFVTMKVYWLALLLRPKPKSGTGLDPKIVLVGKMKPKLKNE